MLPRGDFPILDRQSLIYLDSAATALKPRQVIVAEQLYAMEFTANIHRSNHLLGDLATEAYEDARRSVANFVNAAPNEVVFVRNATEAINVVANGLPVVDRIIASINEHHSNLVPWMRRGPITWIESHPTEPISIEAVQQAIERHLDDVKILTISYASNVTGVIHPIADICKLAREHGVLTCVDASQAIAHLPIDMDNLDCDFLVFSGHKLMGPTGIGVLVGPYDLLNQMNPLVFGGGAIERVTTKGFTLKASPYRYEAGTPHISGAIGLAAAIRYLQQFSWDDIAAHEKVLATRMATVFAEMSWATALMSQHRPRLALGSLAYPGHAFDVGRLLSDQFDIMVRTGFHCTHPLFDALGMNGALRVSPYLYNTIADIDRFADALHTIHRRFG